MTSKKNKKGFTLMEMLIVVAIIVILVAIMIPTFNSQLEKTREAADAANIRAAYAEAMVNYLDDGSTDAIEVSPQQKKAGWTNEELLTNLESAVGTENDAALKTVVYGKKVKVSVSESDKGETTVSIKVE